MIKIMKFNLRVHLLVCNWSGELNNKKRNTAIKPKITAAIESFWFHIFRYKVVFLELQVVNEHSFIMSIPCFYSEILQNYFYIPDSSNMSSCFKKYVLVSAMRLAM